MTEERAAALEREVVALRAALEPQALRAALERTWNPRGTADDLRVQNTAGLLLPLRKRIKFEGATLVDDPAGKRTVITAGGLQGLHDADATPDDGSRLKFVVPGDPATIRSALTTRSDPETLVGGWLRTVELAASEADPYSDPRSRVTLKTASGATDPGVASTAVLRASRGGLAGVFASDTLSGPTSSRVTLEAQRGAGQSLARLFSLAGAKQGEVELQAEDSSGTVSLTATIDGYAATILNNTNGRSEWLRVAKPTGPSGQNVCRVLRGPFTASPGSIAALGTASVVVGSAVVSVVLDPVVMGSLTGPAGVELVAWSWVAGPASDEVTISFTNASAGALTPQVSFYTICDA